MGTAEEDVDYCFDPSPVEEQAFESPTPTPTSSPTASPTITRSPTDHPTTAIFANRSQDFPELIYFSPDLVGPSWKTAGMGPFGRCAGDCDSDDDCRDNLVCFQRTGFENAAVPGCMGTAEKDVDYCFDPSTSSPSAAP